MTNPEIIEALWEAYKAGNTVGGESKRLKEIFDAWLKVTYPHLLKRDLDKGDWYAWCNNGQVCQIGENYSEEAIIKLNEHLKAKDVIKLTAHYALICIRTAKARAFDPDEHQLPDY